MPTLHNRTYRSLSRTLLLYVILVSSLITLVTTSVQLYFEYKTDMTQLNTLGSQIKTGYLKGLSTAAWNLDEYQARVILDGLAALPDVTYAGLYIHGERMSSSGKKNSRNAINLEWNLIYQEDNFHSEYGNLRIQISTRRALKSLFDSIFAVLLSNGIRTFFIASFILFIVDYLITRHLVNISTTLKGIESLEKDLTPLRLKGKRQHKSELDIVTDSFNALLQRLAKSWEIVDSNEKNYRQLLENSNRGIIILDGDDIKFWNNKFLNFFEISTTEEVDLQELKPYSHHYEIQKNLKPDEISTLIANTKTKEFDLQRIKLNGEPQYLQAISSAAIWKNKAVSLLFFTDVTDKKKLEDTIKQQQLMLIQSDKMNTLGVMVSGISHQINNPNQLIRLNSNIIYDSWNEVIPLLKQHCHDNPHATLCNIPMLEMNKLITQAIKDTQLASEDINSIILELKTFIREDTKINISSHKLNNLLNQIKKFVRHKANEKNVKVRFNLPSLESRVYCNKTLINQSLTNIVINAIEACESHKGEINLSLEHTKNEVIIVIEDNGIGIAENKIPRIFDLFYTSKSNQGGTGIGLALAYSLIKKQGGNISVESQINTGTTFRVTLPLSIHSTNQGLHG